MAFSFKFRLLVCFSLQIVFLSLCIFAKTEGGEQKNTMCIRITQKLKINKIFNAGKCKSNCFLLINLLNSIRKLKGLEKITFRPLIFRDDFEGERRKLWKRLTTALLSSKLKQIQCHHFYVFQLINRKLHYIFQEFVLFNMMLSPTH